MRFWRGPPGLWQLQQAKRQEVGGYESVDAHRFLEPTCTRRPSFLQQEQGAFGVHTSVAASGAGEDRHGGPTGDP